jgi:2-polyprenyl-3-methyl-5-hydroxy-6-metoxy-1,4-benzoquinol methylase
LSIASRVARTEWTVTRQGQPIRRPSWASGDHGHIGVRLQVVGEQLCEAVDLDAGEHVLDVAAGNGNASLAAARRNATVISTDYVPELLEQGCRRADADRLPIA